MTQTDSKNSSWISATVLSGDKTGRTINSPTINLDPNLMPSPERNRPGVYGCLVKVDNAIYRGALYFGPRLVKGETENVLEIFILDFCKNIYNQTIQFRVELFIRPPENFDSLEKLRETITTDVALIDKEIKLP